MLQGEVLDLMKPLSNKSCIWTLSSYNSTDAILCGVIEIGKGIWSKNTDEKENTVKILQGCENSQPANFVGCEISQHCSLHSDCFLTRLFMALYKFSLDVILVPLYIFVISLILSTYISSVKLVFSIKFSIHQSINKNWARSFLSLGYCVIFSSFPPFSFIFLVAKHPLMMKNQGMFG